jgi:DNA segregation ATPase FtsK/SpoIIIE-like protein
MNKLFSFFDKLRKIPVNERTYKLINFPSQSRERDPLFSEVVSKIYDDELVSPRTIQQKMMVGYARAVRIIEDLEHSGIVAPQAVSPRRVFKENAQLFLNNPQKYDGDRLSEVTDYLNHKS